MKTLLKAAAGAALAASLAAGAAGAASLKVTVTNEQAAGGLYFTPVLTVFHDGSYDPFDAGSPASSGVETLAETGNPAVEIAGGLSGGAFGVAGAGPIAPGASASFTLNVDPLSNRFLSFLSMVIPSNDLFIGNDSPTAYQVFDAAGIFTGLMDIVVSTAGIWDAGTEANTNLGAAFNAAGGTETDTNDVISLLGNPTYLNGQTTIAGTTVSVGDQPTTLARISVSVVPLPATLPLGLAGIGLLGVVARRKRR